MHSSLIFASMKRALWGGKHLFCYANNNHGKVLKGEKKKNLSAQLQNIHLLLRKP